MLIICLCFSSCCSCYYYYYIKALWAGFRLSTFKCSCVLHIYILPGFPQRMASPSPAASPHPQTNNLPRQVNDHQQPFNIPSSLPQQLRSQPTLTAQDANNTHQDFQHVPRDLLPSDPHMYWRLSEEEKTLLTQLSSAYQDTIMTLPERVPFEGGGLVPGEHGEPLSVRSMESIFESSEKNTRQLIDFVQRLGDFHLLREDDKIAMLQVAGDMCFLLLLFCLFFWVILIYMSKI